MEFAKKEGLIIISKDSDFVFKLEIFGPPPKVIQIKIGNCSIKVLHQMLSACWDKVLDYIQDYDLVEIYRDRIEFFKFKSLR